MVAPGLTSVEATGPPSESQNEFDAVVTGLLRSVAVPTVHGAYLARFEPAFIAKPHPAIADEIERVEVMPVFPGNIAGHKAGSQCREAPIQQDLNRLRWSTGRVIEILPCNGRFC